MSHAFGTFTDVRLEIQRHEHSIQLLGAAIQPLIRHLRKKESRTPWRRPPNFKGIGDLLFYTPNRRDRSPGIATPAFPGMTMHSVDAE